MSDKIAEIRARHERDNRYGDGLYPGAHKDRAFLLAECERLRGEMPVAESRRVDAKCAEIERDEARAVVWKQAKENADLRAEVERLRAVVATLEIVGKAADDERQTMRERIEQLHEIIENNGVPCVIRRLL